MALVLADRVRDTTTTTGTGTVTLSGTAPTGYQTFGSAIGNANTTYYTINAGSQWEVGIGTYSSTGPTLARTTILASSSAGAAVDFAVGTKDVFVTYPAEKSVNYDASNNVGIGTTAPASLLHVDAGVATVGRYGSSGAVVLRTASGTQASPTAISSSTAVSNLVSRGYDGSAYRDVATISVASDGAISASSSPGYIQFNTTPSGSITATERARIDSSGNVGIGAAPLGFTPLYIYRSGSDAGLRAERASGAALDMFATASIAYFGTANSYPLTFQTNGSEKVRIDTSGNVGIGTSSPTAGAGYTSVSIRNATNGGNIDLGVGSTIYGQWLATSASSRLLAANGAYQTFEVGGTERMRIDTSGNVGIGTSSPAQKLSVSGNIVTAGEVALSGADFVYSWAGGTTGQRRAGFYLDGSNQVVRVYTAQNEVARFDASGNVGIGTSTPNYRTHIYNANNGYGLQVGSNAGGASAGNYTGILMSPSNGGGNDPYYSGAIRVQTTAASPAYQEPVMTFLVQNPSTYQLADVTEKMRITGSGNVGIGATAPQGKLDVQSRSSGTVTTGLVLDNRVANSVGTGIDLRFYVNDGGDARYAAVRSTQSISGNYADLRFLVSNSTTPAEAMRINPDGAVQLSVGGVSNTHQFLYNESGGEIQLVDSTGAGPILLDNSGGLARLLKVGSGSMAVGTTSTGFLRFQTADTERMRINSTGVLQVNTTSTPTYGSPKLVVDGGISGKGTVTINSSTATTIAEGAGLLILVRDTTNGGTAVVSYENATTPVIIATSGGTTFQTGTPSGSAQIQLTNKSGNLGIAALASGDRNGDSLSVTILQAFT